MSVKLRPALDTALDAIDRIYWDRLHIDNYSRGACGHCAELLARYLTEQLGITPEYVCRDFHNEAGDWLTVRPGSNGAVC